MVATATTKGLKYLIHDTARLPYPTNTDKQPSMIMHNIITNGTEDVKKLLQRFIYYKRRAAGAALFHMLTAVCKKSSGFIT